jgi:hypothetical protein
LTAIFDKLFTPSRNLKPAVKKREAVALDSAGTSKIMIHLIKGFRMPVRASSFR